MKYTGLLFLLFIGMFEGIAQKTKPFSAGNIVVFRVGDGTSMLDGMAAKTFLDEYSPEGVLVQSIPMPYINDGVNSLLTVTGQDVSAGMLSLSSNGKFLLVPGTNRELGNEFPPTASVIGVVNIDGEVNSTTLITDATEAGSGTRTVASNDGVNLWVGLFGALRYTTMGSSSSVKLNTRSNQARMSSLLIMNGNLYQNATSAPYIRQVGSGLPVECCPVFEGLPGLPGNIPGPGQFALIDARPDIPGPDLLYLAAGSSDISSSAGISKFSLVNGLWMSNGSVGGEITNSWYMGLTVMATGDKVTVFATRQGANNDGTKGGELVKLEDNAGYNEPLRGVPVVIAAVATKDAMAFRGVALVPQNCSAVTHLEASSITASKADISWSGGRGDYEYAITRTSDAPTSGTLTKDPFFAINDLTDKTIYYVHVRSRCNGMFYSDWTTISFESGCQSPSASSLAINILRDGDVDIRWKRVTGAVNYDYQISTSPTLTSPLSSTVDTGIIFKNAQSVTKYFLHLRSDCASEGHSNWVIKNFEPGCIMPAVSNINVFPAAAEIRWRRSINAIKYEYALTYNAAKPVSGKESSDTVFTVTKLSSGSAMYFHVRSVCVNGSTSEWNSVQVNVQGLQVFPNPVQNKLWIRLSGTSYNPAAIIITDAMGKVMAKSMLVNNQLTVNTQAWMPGIFFIRYDDGNNKYALRVLKK